MLESVNITEDGRASVIDVFVRPHLTTPTNDYEMFRSLYLLRTSDVKRTTKGGSVGGATTSLGGT